MGRLPLWCHRLPTATLMGGPRPVQTPGPSPLSRLAGCRPHRPCRGAHGAVNEGCQAPEPTTRMGTTKATPRGCLAWGPWLTWSCSGLRGWSVEGRGLWGAGLRGAVSRVCSCVPPRGGAGPAQKVLLRVLQPLQVRDRGGGSGGRSCPLPPPAGCGAGRRQVPDGRELGLAHSRGRGTHTGRPHGARRVGGPRWRSAPRRTPLATAGHSR